MRRSGGIELIFAVQVRHIHERPGCPLLQTCTNRQRLNAWKRHFPLILEGRARTAP